MKYTFETDKEVTSCGNCPFNISGWSKCWICWKPISDEKSKPDWCPLKEVTDSGEAVK